MSVSRLRAITSPSPGPPGAEGGAALPTDAALSDVEQRVGFVLEKRVPCGPLGTHRPRLGVE